MASPPPPHLRSPREIALIPISLRDHKDDLRVNFSKPLRKSSHPAKYAPGLPTILVELAGSNSIGDPFAGTGRLAEETELPIALNDIDRRWEETLMSLTKFGCEVTIGPAAQIPWKREVLIFSPPYYPRTDRRKLAGHNDLKRGKVVGFRSGYGGAEITDFIGDPAGINGILTYRNAMRDVFSSFIAKSNALIIVVKNQTRLGVELRLDLDTILTAHEAGWHCIERHGWKPVPSLWARYNLTRGTGIDIEDILIFNK